MRLIKLAMAGKTVVWDIGQRHRALRAAKDQCYVGLLLVVVQAIAHREYKALRGVDPVFMDQFVTVWLVSGYYVTLVWTAVIYLAMLRFSSSLGGPGALNKAWWWWRLDARSKHLLQLLVPLCCLVLAGQLFVCLTYPFVYKDVLYNNLMHGIDEYHTSTPVRKFIDHIQEAYNCCGFHSYHDWIRLRRTKGSGYLPITCCQKGFVCDRDNIVNYLANYKTWYETEDFSIKNTKGPFKEKYKFFGMVPLEVPEKLPFREKGCGGKLLDVQTFYWPVVFDLIQFIMIIRALVNIRRYSTATAFANRAVYACKGDYTMLSAAHACPRWTLRRPNKEALRRWQDDYLVQIYFCLVHRGEMEPDERHKDLYPDRPITMPDFGNAFDKKVQEYKKFLRKRIRKKKKKRRKKKKHKKFVSSPKITNM